MAESAVTAVVGNMSRLVIQETTFLCGVTVEVTFLKDELMRLQGYLKDADVKRRSGNAAVAILVVQIRDAAYVAENVIKAVEHMQKSNRLKKGFVGAVSRYAHLPADLVNLHQVGVQVKHVRRKISEIFESAHCLKIDLDTSAVEKCHDEDEFPQDYCLMHQNFEDDIVMVGFQDEYKEIVDKLVHGENMLSVVSIVAMGGAGKTTLARKVCTSSRVKQHFDTIAWVSVSQKFKGIDLLNDIMKQMMNVIANMPHLVYIYLEQFNVLDKLPESHHFPQSLRELHLSADVIKQDPMPILEKLPCLVVLVLQGYDGHTMCCSAQRFPRLQELQLFEFSIEEWRMEIGAMPKLST
ncbi:putative disease resistance protein At1g50180 [Triticum aestivum]|uniref:putative disease resistance protein At1g50180 n=1 Tax=Triticum aestivum TaxID=4565 RepID=UPI001D031DA6|nr:putative disease resistance protein At1g50180 [Triticum aestivum]